MIILCKICLECVRRNRALAFDDEKFRRVGGVSIREDWEPQHGSAFQPVETIPVALETGPLNIREAAPARLSQATYSATCGHPRITRAKCSTSTCATWPLSSAG